MYIAELNSLIYRVVYIYQESISKTSYFQVMNCGQVGKGVIFVYTALLVRAQAVVIFFYFIYVPSMLFILLKNTKVK